MPCPESGNGKGPQSSTEVVKDDDTKGSSVQIGKEDTALSTVVPTPSRVSIEWTEEDENSGRLQIESCKGFLPNWLVKCFHHIDQTGHEKGETGWLQRDQIEEILNLSVAMRKAMNDNSAELDLSWFSPAVREVLQVWDVDESGTVGMSELVSAAKAQQKLKKTNKFLRMAVVVLIVVLVILMAGQLVLGYVSAQLAEDSRPDASGIARTVGTNQIMGMAGVTKPVQLPLIHNSDKYSLQALASIKSVSFKTVSGNHAYEVIGAYRGMKEGVFSTILLCATGHEVRVTPDTSKVYWPKKEMEKWEPLLDKKGERRLKEDDSRRFEYIMNTHRPKGRRLVATTAKPQVIIEESVEQAFDDDNEYLAECSAQRVCEDSEGNYFCKGEEETDCSVHCKEGEVLCLEMLDPACAFPLEDFDGDFSKGLDCKADYYCWKGSECPNIPDPIPPTKQQSQARFLIQATFGVTTASLAEIADMTYEEWIQAQIKLPKSSHRQFAREHSNPRLDIPISIGTPWRPCDRGSRWTRRAVSENDRRFEIRYEGGALYVNDNFRTFVPKDTGVFQATWVQTYFVCRVDVDTNEVSVSQSERCPGKQSGYLHFTNPTLAITTEPKEGGWSWSHFRSDEQTMVSDDDSYTCDVVEEGNTTFAKHDRNIWRLENRLQLRENSLDRPFDKLADQICPTTKRNFINSDSCTIVTGCETVNVKYEAQPDQIFTPGVIKKFQQVTHRRIYAVRLTGNDDACGKDVNGNYITSRWVQCGDCKSTIDTNSGGVDKTIHDELNAKLDELKDQGTNKENAFIVDLQIQLDSCVNGHKVGVQSGKGVNKKTLIFEHVDLKSDQVHDLTEWWDDQDPQPATAADDTIVRLEAQESKWFAEDLIDPDDDTVYLGEMGEVYQLRDERFKHVTNDALVHALGQDARKADFIPEWSHMDGDMLSCGSPYEVAAKPAKGHEHFMPTYSRHFTRWNDELWDQPVDHATSNSKLNVWMNLATFAPDQLRQRMAWALAQHFVIGEGGFSTAAKYSEMITVYYDIFVRNAFENFGDVLKEVTYNSVMGSYLTFEKNAAYDRTGYFPDENYAREILQLFTIGLNMLNEDGSEVIKDGATVPSFGLEEVQTNAAIFTGLINEDYRGNIELGSKGTSNKIDPLVMQEWKKDIYPKTDVMENGGYIGDKRRACDDVHPQEFLQQGSVYEFVGSSSPDKEVLTLGKDSPLSLALCGSELAGPGMCEILPMRRLARDVKKDCPEIYSETHAECSASTLGVKYVQMEVDGRFLYFEYVPPECVYRTFLHAGEGAPSVRGRNYQCSPKTLPVAGVKCCQGPQGCNDVCPEDHQGCLDKYNDRVICAGLKGKERRQCRKNNKCGKKDQPCRDSYNQCKKFRSWCTKTAPGLDTCGQTCYEKTGVSYWRLKCVAKQSVVVSPKCEDQPRKRLTYEQAEIACGTSGGALCKGSFEEKNCDWNSKNFARIWEPLTSGDCSQTAYLDMDTLEIRLIETDRSHVTPFRVRWLEPPVQGTDCPEGCVRKTIDDRWTKGAIFCECEVSAKKHVVFESIEELESQDSQDIAQRIKAKLHFRAKERPDTLMLQNDLFKVWGLKGGAVNKDIVIEIGGMYLYNYESIVTIGKTNTFRNPPRFMVQEIVSRRAAENEINALLEHLQLHPNTPPMFAKMLIQRFVSSSPSPGYIRDVATAFKEGLYKDIGTNRHGCLRATIAAVLLHNEARNPQNPWDGKLKEPIIKLVNLFRTYEWKQGNDDAKIGPVMVFNHLDDMIGNAPYKFPDVFGFYTSDHVPARMDHSNHAAPEFNVFTGPFINAFVNGAVSFFQNGLSACRGGFTQFNCPTSKKTPSGFFGYNNSIMQKYTGDDLVNELNLLLTGSSMTDYAVSTVKKVYKDAENNNQDGFLEVQKAMLLTPEFHTTGPQMDVGPRGYTPPKKVPQPRNYKAMIQIYLTGGMDSFNLLVPTSPGCNQTEQYKSNRGSIALPDEQKKNTIDPNNDEQDCKQFAVHSSLEDVYKEYEKGNVAFFPNVGSLWQPVDKIDFKKNKPKLCQGLFSHNDQRNSVQTAKCQIQGAKPKGWGGRLADALAGDFSTTLFSMSGNNVWTSAQETKHINVHPNLGSVRLYEFDEQMKLITGMTRHRYTNIYAEEYQKQLREEVNISEDLGQTLESATLSSPTSTFPGKLGAQLRQVARVISTREERNAERDIFFVKMGGFDMHNEILEDLADKLKDVNDAIKGFIEEMTAQKDKFNDVPLWENVALEIASDFGRSMTSNRDKGGSDHAWAGNYFMASGALKGGKGGTVVTKYSESLSLDGDNKWHIGRGRFIPKYPWDSMSYPLARWMGLKDGDVASVFPNKENFPSDFFLESTELFGK